MSNKTYRYMALSLLATLLAVGCEKDPAIIPDTDKSPIELSVGGVDGVQTRALITDQVSGKQFGPITAGTHVYMVMKSEYVALPDPYGFGGDQTTKYSVTRGEVAASSDVATNDVIFSEDRTRFWDDAHARCSNLSIWAIACPGLDHLGGAGTSLSDNTVRFTTTEGLKSWQTSEIKADAIEWNVPHFSTSESYFTATSLADRDLCFSNNLVNYGSGNDRRLKFNNSTSGKFDGGKLVFYHALSKITVNIKIGDGFTGENDFRFTETETHKNATLQYFNIWGKFNVETGEWSTVNTGHQAITGMYNLTGTTPITDTQKPAYQLEALVIPYISSDSKTVKGSLIDNSDYKAVVFTIDNNKYEVSRADLLKALQDKADNGIAGDAASVELQAGKNYVFTFTVGKTKIKNITAQVVDWETVEADNVTPSNARIKLQVEERGTAYPSGNTYSLYRSTANYTPTGIDDSFTAYDWKTGYSGNMTTPTYVAASGGSPAHWTTSWFWDSNKHFYHFRVLAPTTVGITAESTNGDFATLNAGESYTDVLWGAPMLDKEQNESDDASSLKWKYGPTVNGFDSDDNGSVSNALPSGTAHQIYKAIGATEDPVKLILFHMMSDVTFKVKTTNGTDAVNLGNGSTEKTTIELQKIHTTGKLFLGNGLVLGNTANVGSSSFAFAPSASVPDSDGYLTWANYGAVPQDLTNVVLVITTPDNNQYKVAMKDVVASTVTNNNIANPYTATNGKYTINRWYPGFKYNYSFTLKKTGITNLEATVVDWETVTAGDDNVTIE